MSTIVRQARVRTEADETYILTRYDDASLHVERTHSSARSPRIADDDFIATGPIGGMYDLTDGTRVTTGIRSNRQLIPGSWIWLELDGVTITSAAITDVELLVTNSPNWAGV